MGDRPWLSKGEPVTTRNDSDSDNNNHSNGRRQVLPIVLHKVTAKPDSFEDIIPETLEYILSLIAAHNEISSSRDIVLTFDDGNLSDYTEVFPRLRDQGLSAVFFPIAGQVGTPGYVSWSQLKEMALAGMEIGSHSLTHADLARLDTETLDRELGVSRHMLEDGIGTGVESFSFPYGSFNKSCIEAAWRNGYAHCYTSRHGLGGAADRVLPRNSVNGTMSRAEIEAVVAATACTRIGWWVEDRVKSSIKSVFGPSVYKLARGLIRQR